MSYIHAAYQLRDELGTLHNMDTSRGNATSDFTFPVEKGCEVLKRIYPENNDLDEESIEAVARLLCEVSDRYPQVITWSSISDIVMEALDPLMFAVEERVGDILDFPPSEMIDIWISLLDDINILADHRLSC